MTSSFRYKFLVGVSAVSSRSLSARLFQSAPEDGGDPVGGPLVPAIGPVVVHGIEQRLELLPVGPVGEIREIDERDRLVLQRLPEGIDSRIRITKPSNVREDQQ